MSKKTPLLLAVALLMASHFLPLPAQPAPQGQGHPASPELARTVVAAIPEHWPPQYSQSKSGEPEGFAIDVFNHLSNQLGLTVEYKTAKTFRGAIRLLESGAADVIPNSGIVDERLDGSLFSDPVETFHIVIFTRTASPLANRFGTLHGKAVGVVERNAGLFLLRERKDIDLTVYDSAEHALFGLLSGSVDAVVYPDTVFEALARHFGVEDKITTVGSPLKEIRRGLRFRHDQEALHKAYNDAVGAFVLTPEFNDIYTKWYGTPTPFWNSGRVLMAMSGLLAAVVLGLLIWRYASLRRVNRALVRAKKQLSALNVDLEHRVKQRTAALSREIEQRKHTQHVVETFFNQRQTLNLVVDLAGRIERMNMAWVDVLGFSEQDLKSQPFMTLVHPDDLEETRQAFAGLLEGQEVDGFENRWRCQNGTYVNLLWSARADLKDGLVYAIARDVTAQKAAERQLKLSAGVFTSANEGIMITDPDGVIVDVNAAFTAITGYEREDVTGKNARVLQSGRHDKAFYHDMWECLTTQGSWRGEIWNKARDGRIYPEMLTISAVQSADGATANFVGLFSDISAMKDHERELEHLAQYDKLTDLPNRALLADRLNQAMARAARHSHHIAIVFIDLDGFKSVNDTSGHAAGDALLVAVAQRLHTMLRAEDTLARIGGDEFVAIITDLADPADCIGTLDRLHAAVASPFEIDGGVVNVTASSGVTFFPQSKDMDADQLERQADQAMYEAKLAGRNQYHFFDPEQDQQLASRFARIAEAKTALENGEFLLHFQPKIDLDTHLLLGCEALLRWQHPTQGLLSPAAFLPPIEDHPSIALPLGNWVLETSLQKMEDWHKEGLDIGVSVNVSAVQLLAPDFLEQLQALLDRYPGVRPGKLELEILETSALNDLDRVSGLIRSCQTLGVRFALDDFGTGYSSLMYLRQLPLHTLKIDQGFVRDMLDNRQDQEILKSMIGFGRIFDLEVLAEGVETDAHGAMLRALGCRYAQGYAIARPMPAEDIPRWYLDWCRRHAVNPERAARQAAG